MPACMDLKMTFYTILSLLFVVAAVLSQDDDLLQQLNDTTRVLARQLMLEHWYRLEKARSEGCSGIKEVRHQRDGTRPYHTETHIGSGVASIHDHADSVATMGMGEFNVVLNGVEFRTRHNDYLLKMPSTTSTKYHEMEDVPFPEVPPSVLEQTSVKGQIKEMQEYFRAFKQQDTSIRDYKPYFKPVLSYLEGAWTYTGEEVDEPFPGERHWIDAKTWKELEDKVMFTGYSGGKDALENLAYLPRAVFGIKNDSIPVLAQWNYRILCHPLKNDLPTNRLRVLDDMATRMVTRQSLKDISATREARFTFNPTDSKKWSHGRYVGTLLDDLMSEIPGKDNYLGTLNDEAFGLPALDPKTGLRLNTAYYHHLNKYDIPDGMGLQIRHRGFSDETVFMAMTTQEKVAGMNFDNCMNTWENRSRCHEYKQKWSYAFPMELIYLTPLNQWNPYNIRYYGWSDEPEAQRVTQGGKDGTKENPYDGVNSMHFYRTPAEFFDKEHSVRPADTTGSDVYVLDSEGNAQRVRASGHRICIPSIPGVGQIRQRYPVMPIHDEGNTIWKELNALKDIVLAPKKYKHMFYTDEDEQETPEVFYAKLTMEPASQQYGGHTHECELNQADHDLLLDGGVVQTTSTPQNGHQHQLSLTLEPTLYGYPIRILKCDSANNCWDGHNMSFRPGFTTNGTFVEDFEYYVALKTRGKSDAHYDTGADKFKSSMILWTITLSLLFLIAY